MNTETKAIPIDDLMDASLDDIADLPGFDVPPPGRYKLALTLEYKVVNEKPAFEAKLVINEVIELANQTDTPPEVGSKFSSLYFLDNEIGQGYFKELAKTLAAGLNMENPKISQLLETCNNILVQATLKQRVHKEDVRKPKDEQRVYAQLSDVSVA